ncbi:MAG: hypothetical protein R2856_27420 [Caldilineaceae bacterium]
MHAGQRRRGAEQRSAGVHQNNRQWNGPAIDPGDVARWRGRCPQGVWSTREPRRRPINLATPKDDLWAKSQRSNWMEYARALYGIPRGAAPRRAHRQRRRRRYPAHRRGPGSDPR